MFRRLFIPVALLFVCGFAEARGKNKSGLVYWSSSQGMRRFESSRHKADFFHLSNQFQNQTDSLTCGPVTGAVTLNALRLGRKKKLPQTAFNEAHAKYLPRGFDPRIRRYTPENFMAGGAQKIKTTAQLYGRPAGGKKDFGLQIRQLHRIFLFHGAKSQLRVVSENLPDRLVKAELTANLKTEGDFIVINYKRSALGQKGGGHISPLGAYDETSDSFLIMDVNSGKYGWVWVRADILIAAMRTFDTEENRGYLLIKD